MSDESSITALIASVAEEYGRLDVLVNNAGTGVAGTVEHTDTRAWRHVFAVDVDGVFFASRAALPHLRRVGGCIVNVGSVSGLGADWGLAAYNAAKGALVNLTNAVALDHGHEGVRVNAVHPASPAPRWPRPSSTTRTCTQRLQRPTTHVLNDCHSGPSRFSGEGGREGRRGV
ncbi:SDR family NAD(P)-dependent oxidoreductase [Streptomyces sp. NPDC090022]|uniref:SDR family NAD(P)-dependent oxidoreductase n=1 Tax=Streptomyces sp. NPDC090022 TaxID=3365920 RepID=UPI00382887D8